MTEQNQIRPALSRRNKIIREIILVLLGFSVCGATIFVGWVSLMALCSGWITPQQSAMRGIQSFGYSKSCSIQTSTQREIINFGLRWYAGLGSMGIF